MKSARPQPLSHAESLLLHEAAQDGRVHLRWPEDRSWIDAVWGGGGDSLRRLNRMRAKGLLEPIARGRWIVLPIGASTLAQAASPKVVLAAYFDGRADWYLGFLSALVDHRLTDVASPLTHVAVRAPGGRRQWPGRRKIGNLDVKLVRITRRDDWEGVERERVQGRVFGFRSDVARTLIDTLDHPELCGSPEVWVRAWERAMREERVDVGRLVDYAEGRSGAVQARLAFWLRETGHVRSARRAARALGAPVGGRRLLDPSRSFGDGRWPRDRETGLVVNIPQPAIDGWLEYAPPTPARAPGA